MYILGLTGPIASGKSTVCETFKREKVPYIDADDLVHKCYEANSPVNIALVNKFTRAILDESTGNIDRKALLNLIKENSTVLKDVENILYPELRLVMKNELAKAYTKSSSLAVIIVPLMFENGFNELCDKVAVCSCTYENRHRRFLSRPESTEEKWDFITSKQMTTPEYIERCDFIINTDCSILETNQKTIEIITKLSGEFGIKWKKEWQKI